jgi:hypothetical protein
MLCSCHVAGVQHSYFSEAFSLAELAVQVICVSPVNRQVCSQYKGESHGFYGNYLFQKENICCGFIDCITLHLCYRDTVLMYIECLCYFLQSDIHLMCK